MTRVPFGTTASPFLLTATLQYHFKRVEPALQATAQQLSENFYVDDLVTGVSSSREALRIFHDANTILNSAGMKLQKWSTNDDKLRQVISQGSETPSEAAPTKVLGILWNTNDDRLRLNIEPMLMFLQNKEDTKRFVLQTTARIFDPLGWLSPFLVRIKFLFQRLWQHGTTWEEAMPATLHEEWKNWCEELQGLQEFSLPRCELKLCLNQSTGYQLHIFADASTSAYGVVAYLKVIDEDGIATIQLLISKCRVAPMKRISLPRLELVAAVLAARVLKFLRDALSSRNWRIEEYCWTDSTVTLCWIRSSAVKWKQFVSNRVIEIQKTTDPAQWNHCPGIQNPADLVTRGLPLKDALNNRLWWKGPDWLSKTSDCWPTMDNFTPSMASDELLNCELKTVVPAMIIVTKQALFSPEKYSSWIKMVRVTAWIRRFVNNCRSANHRRHGALSTQEVQEAEYLWFRQAQTDTYGKEIAHLTAGHSLEKSSSIRELHPYIDDKSILRIRTRLENADLTCCEKTPVLLPNNHPVTHLIVMRAHQTVLHGGVGATLAEIRARFWVVRARQAVKRAIGKCLTCARFRAKATSAPVAPLPCDRVRNSRPFEITGVDFAGPMFVKDHGGAKKVYIVLFSCAVVRAIHIEYVLDLTANSFLMAFKRFCARRGTPRVVYSDNATTFKKAARDLDHLHHLLRKDEVTNYCANNKVTWKFTAEKAPWWGGFWERLVRIVKDCLRRSIGRRTLNLQELITLLAETEAVVNSRPITFTYSSPTEPNVLTPSHFLLGCRLLSTPRSLEEPRAETTYLNLWVHRQRALQHLWKRWLREYLLLLRSAHSRKVHSSHSIEQGDIVIVHEDNIPRMFWKTAVISECLKGKDGVVRACKIRLPQGSEVVRPVQKLYRLELFTSGPGVC
uniref:Putative tick transposon n=1 Tax=Rhipicephalus pulchellus TaxID=72859 RepID=L7LXX7_RHIPC